MELEAKHARELNQMQNQIHNLMKMHKEEENQDAMKRRTSFASMRKPSFAQPPLLSRENSKAPPKKLPLQEAIEYKLVKDAIAVEEVNKPSLQKNEESTFTKTKTETPKKKSMIKPRAVTYIPIL